MIIYRYAMNIQSFFDIVKTFFIFFRYFLKIF